MDITDNDAKFHALRRRFSKLVYDGHSVTDSALSVKVEYAFSLRGQDADLAFRPSLEITKPAGANWRSAVSDELDAFFFHLGLVEAISYWKCACPKLVQVNAGWLEPDRRAWFEKLYLNGLGEFIHRNGIQAAPADFVHLDSPPKAPRRPPTRLDASTLTLVPVGGGKDSVVTLEALRGLDTLCLCVNPIPASLRTVAAAGMADRNIVVKRTIDPKLLELNNAGFLNGHTPFSALLAAVGTLVAALAGAGRIALSNESSANEPNLRANGLDINHQYSKSLEFESDFRAYAAAHLSPDIDYFSFLRPLNELTIARLFARHPQYLTIANSCNQGGRADRRCGKCAKCLFTYIMLAPFVDKAALDAAHGGCPLENPALQGTLDELRGLGKTKPFDCVGTYEEVNSALAAIAQTGPPPLLLRAAGAIESTPLTELLGRYDNANFLPPDLAALLKKELRV